MANVKNIENCNEVREPLTIEEENCKGDENKKRGNWSKQMEFTLSMVGYSVGFGNLWRFPYLFTRNGGVAFMVPFLLFLLLCGLPLFYLEVIIGQFSSLSPPKVWKMCPLFQGIGYSSAFLSGVVCIHFAVINSWAIYFTAISCQKVLPWSYCDNEWNSDTCTSPFQRWDTEMNQTNASFAMSMIRNVSVEPVTESALTVATETSPPSLREQMFGKHLSSSAEFWEFHVLDTSSGFGDFGSIRWQLTVALAVGWIMVFLSHIRGVKSLGKVVYFTALMPYLLLTVFFVRCLMLPGGLDGLLYFFKPSFHKLLEIKVWAEALLQVFYSLGPGWGGLITMASYNKFNHDCYRDALIVTVTDSATCLYGGMVMYSALGFMSYSANVHISQLTAFGPGLLFIVYPEICLHLPASPIWSFLFFFMLITLGMDSQFGMFETLVSGLVDTFPSTLQKRKCLVALVIAVSCFLMGIIFVTQGGIFLLQISDWYIPAFTPVVIACVECIIVVWIYGCDRISSDIMVMVGKKPSMLIRTCWCIVTPLLMMITLIFVLTNYKSPSYGNYQYPESAQTFGWILATASLFPLPGLMIWRLLKAKGAPKQRLCQLVQPAPDWGPALEKHRALCPQTNWSYDGGFVKQLKKNIFN